MDRVNLEDTLKVNKELVNALKENFKLKYDKDFYSFSGSSAAMIIDSKTGEMKTGFTEEENAAMSITRKEYDLRQIEREVERLATVSKLGKYIKRLRLTPYDLVKLFPTELELKQDIDDEDEDDYDDCGCDDC